MRVNEGQDTKLLNQMNVTNIIWEFGTTKASIAIAWRPNEALKGFCYDLLQTKLYCNHDKSCVIRAKTLMFWVFNDGLYGASESWVARGRKPCSHVALFLKNALYLNLTLLRVALGESRVEFSERWWDKRMICLIAITIHILKAFHHCANRSPPRQALEPIRVSQIEYVHYNIEHEKKNKASFGFSSRTRLHVSPATIPNFVHRDTPLIVPL